MFKKGAFTIILAALIILGLTATSFANPGKGNTGWKFSGKGNGKVVQFNDIGSHWAAQTIREMNRLGITSGYPDYSFKPNTPVSRYEALMMICRAMDDFEQEDGLSWEDRREECLDFAVENDIIDGDEDFEGWKPAKRYEVAMWAMRANGDLDIDDEALPFLDINDIPEVARHYVGVMFKHKWMVGYPDKRFQPNKPVTRAELTVIIYRMLDNEWPDYDDGDLSALRVKSLDPKDGEDKVDNDTEELVATFNMNIEEVEDMADVEDGIKVEKNVTDDYDEVSIKGVNISGNKLIIELDESLENDKRYRVTIDGDIIQSEDGEEEFDGLSDGDWEFYTYDADEEEITLVSLDPEDGDDEVAPSTDELRATFDNDISFIDEDLSNAVRVYNVDDDDNVGIDKIEIDGETLVITLEEELGADDTFRVTIKSGYIEDEDTGADYGGLGGNNWLFTTTNE